MADFLTDLLANTASGINLGLKAKTVVVLEYLISSFVRSLTNFKKAFVSFSKY